ncbi:PspC domain-containing protein [Halalkalibacter nanhaiisediminis]|uniref:Phage shock protein C (PspC) family protein n=1 Tax=Halalkalibacter nanhaiisediminis TaxID=688079 RepID=A0A562QT99_9BACI|nr:PspC domain-containing protein [Halalkalibacter nanhaiisediminis]TWI59982.1 phage shock protein C (PspC) family protein [Halalkalibacter nanhaiisediminis]
MKRLYRSQYERKIAGVCGGLAKYFSMNPTIVRILVVVLALFTAAFPVIVGYLIAAAIIPNEKDVSAE